MTDTHPFFPYLQLSNVELCPSRNPENSLLLKFNNGMVDKTVNFYQFDDLRVSILAHLQV